MKKLIILVMMVVVLFGSSIQEAKKLFDEEEKYKEAIEIFQQFPNDGEALYYFGKAYFYGIGVEKDLNKAFEYAKKSATQNNPSGLNLLGVMYKYGDGVEKDELQALMYYKQAANLGNAKAMRNLGMIYAIGDIVKKDLEVAEQWFLKAYEQGNENDALELAKFYSSTDVKKYNKAIPYYKIYEKSSPKKLDYIYERLGDCYFEINQYEQSYNYYLKAAKLDNVDAMISIYNKFPEAKDIVSIEQRIYWLEKAAMQFNNEFAIDFYLSDKDIHYKDKLSNLEKLYKQGNHTAGCQLVSYYSIPLNEDRKTTHEINYDKSFQIATNILSNNHEIDDVWSCYHTLRYFYRMGDYFAKDIQEAIKLNKKQFEKSKYFKSSPAIDLASIYLEELEDFDNARKWYKIAYELTNDEEYLSIVDEYMKNKPNYIIDKKSEQAIFPILDNFAKKEQVATYLETEKYYFLSTDNKSIRMYDKENLQFLKEFRSWVEDGLLGIFITMTFDESKQLLYTSTLNSYKDLSKNDIIKVFDINTGKVVKTIDNPKAVKNKYLTISDDGKYLVAINNFNLLNIIDIETNSIQHYNLNGEGNFLKAKIEKKDDDYLIHLVSADYQLLYTFSLDQKKRIDKKAYQGQVSFEKVFSNTVNHSNNDMEKLLNFKPFDITELQQKSNIIEIKSKNSSLSFDFNNLSLKEMTEYIYKKQNNNSSIKVIPKHENKVLEVYDANDKFLSEISLSQYANALKYMVLDEKYILVVTSDITNMLIFTLEGKPIANLSGFKSFQINLDYENGLLIAYGSDNIINIFDLKNLDKYAKKEKKYNQEILKSFSDIYGGNPLDLFHETDEEILELSQYLNQQFGYKPTADQVRYLFNLLWLETQEIQPLTSLYIKNEKDWIIYTPGGLFTYGGEGHKLLKYHQNQGLYKEAKIIPNDRLFDKFYRPDLIKKILAGEKVDVPLDVKAVIQNIKPPELKILSNKLLENKKDIDLTYQICDAGNGIADPKLIINGQAINPPTSRGFSIEKIDTKDNKCKVYKSIHTLNSGENTLFVKAYDKDKNIASQSEEIKISTNYKINTKPNLYFLSIAVSDYEEDSLDLKYPVKDVETVKSKIQKQSTTIYENIFTYDLHDNEVTKEKLESTFVEISSKIKINDAFVLYIAGHGISKDGLYQFIPHKSKEKISIDEIKTNLSKIATTKSLVLLDTCQSGAAIESIDTEATKNRLAHDSTINYIVASSSDQVALEGYKEHGVFTYSVLDAFDKNDKLKVWGLADHVSEIVPKITKEKFQYSQVPQAKLNKNFILVERKD